jgi:hypothetical protein
MMGTTHANIHAFLQFGGCVWNLGYLGYTCRKISPSFVGRQKYTHGEGGEAIALKVFCPPPPCPFHLLLTSYCDEAKARRYFGAKYTFYLVTGMNQILANAPELLRCEYISELRLFIVGVYLIRTKLIKYFADTKLTYGLHENRYFCPRSKHMLHRVNMVFAFFGGLRKTLIYINCC